MRAYPNIEMKTFGGCAPGEIVRLQTGPLAMVLGEVGQKPSSFLLFNKKDHAPHYTIPQNVQSSMTLLSYGREFSIEIDQTDFEFGQHELVEAPGILWLDGSNFIIHAARPGIQYGPAFIKLNSGEFVEEPQYNRSARFPRWIINVASSDPQSPIGLFKFEAIGAKG
jgi:hypothetical protein